ncbi:MAG: hypothetical protein JSU70_01360, partial [Phycisphaerales bacterium]
TCPNLQAGEQCQVSFEVHAVGATAEHAKLYAVAANKYSFDKVGPVKVTIASPETPCDAANLDAAGSVNFRDLAVLASQWLLTEPPLSADIDTDQSVDAQDLAAIAEYWLSTCQ